MRRLLTTLLAVLLACAPALAAAEGLWGQLFGQPQEPETILVEIDVAGYGVICLVVYLSVNAAAKRLNRSLRN